MKDKTREAIEWVLLWFFMGPLVLIFAIAMGALWIRMAVAAFEKLAQ